MGQEKLTLSQALDVFSDSLVDIRKACVENYQNITSTPHQEISPDDEWTKENIHLHVEHLKVQEKTDPLVRVIKRIDSRKKPARAGSITDADIERAREYPIIELFIELTGEEPTKGMAHCPFHQDNTPSLSLRKYNRYRCFGCDEKGDSIDLYMKLAGVGFIDAVKKLI